MNSPNNQVSKMSLRQRTKDTATKVEDFQKDLVTIVNAVNEVFGKFQAQMEAQKELLNTLVALAGPEVVQTKLVARKVERDQKAVVEAVAAVDLLKSKNVLLVAPLVTEDSFIIAKEWDKDGNLKTPGRVQVAFNDLLPDFKGKLSSAVVGDSVETPDGGKFEIVEIYSIDQEAAKAAQIDTAVESVG